MNVVYWMFPRSKCLEKCSFWSYMKPGAKEIHQFYEDYIQLSQAFYEHYREDGKLHILFMQLIKRDSEDTLVPRVSSVSPFSRLTLDRWLSAFLPHLSGPSPPVTSVSILLCVPESSLPPSDWLDLLFLLNGLRADWLRRHLRHAAKRGFYWRFLPVSDTCRASS